MSRTSKTVLRSAVLCLLFFVLAACGDDGDDADATSAGAGDDPSSEVVEAEEEAPEGRGVVTENADGTRTVTSSWGTVDVPAEPKRIVSVLGYIDFETLLALGVEPVGAGTQGGTVASGFAPHLAELTDGIEALPWADGAPVESIAALRPDLIFAPDEDSAKLLADIAPTVPAGAAVGTEWKDDFRYIAEVIGRGDDAEDLLAAYEADAEELREDLEPVVGDRTVASPQVAFDHTQVYVDNPDSFSSAILTEIGFTLATIVTETKETPIAISFERLPEIDADILFWQVRQRDEDGTRDTAGFQTAKDSPLWARVPAVAADAVFEVDNRPWYFPTILAARQMLGDIEQALL